LLRFKNGRSFGARLRLNWQRKQTYHKIYKTNTLAYISKRVFDVVIAGQNNCTPGIFIIKLNILYRKFFK
jgi:hypothetical protein